MIPVNRSPSPSGGPDACLSTPAHLRTSPGHRWSRPTLARSVVTIQHDNPSGVPEPDGAVLHEVIDALIYADHQLRLTYRPKPGATLVRLIGEIDATNRTALAETLARAGHGDERLLIDIGHLRFIDIGGMRLLAKLCQAGAACVVNVPPSMRRLAELLDLPLRDGALDGGAERDTCPPRQG
jgi:anti-anti-sigma factor